MFSKEGEKVPFTKIIDPVLAKGNVEKWLVEVEDVMLKSVRQFHEAAMLDYTRKDREKWVISHQGMAVLCIAMMFWTSQAEESMKKGGLEGLKAYSDKLDRQVSIFTLNLNLETSYDYEITNGYLRRMLPPMTFLARDELVFICLMIQLTQVLLFQIIC